MSKASRQAREEIDFVPIESPPEPPAEFKSEDRITQHPDTVAQGLPRSLAQEEASALRRISPRRNRWPELARLDERVAEREQRAAAVQDELQRLSQQRNLAPEHDARALADWFSRGEKGRRPEPSVPELDRRIVELERERDALVRATDDVLAEKEQFVTRHRERLVRDADKEVEKTARSYAQLIEELPAKRAELADARHAAVWARIYPARGADATPPETIVGGKRKTLERAAITAQVQPERLWELLHADAAYLEHALTQEQAQELGLGREGEAVWAGTEQGRRAERKEKQAALARYRQEWGSEPV